MTEAQKATITKIKESPYRMREWWDQYLPPNMTFAWGLGTKSFVEILTRRVMEDGHIATAHQPLWDEEPTCQGQLPETVYASAFAQALRLACNDHTLLVHLVRFDNERVVPENDNNAPFRDIDGVWEKRSKP